MHGSTIASRIARKVPGNVLRNVLRIVLRTVLRNVLRILSIARTGWIHSNIRQIDRGGGRRKVHHNIVAYIVIAQRTGVGVSDEPRQLSVALEVD